MKSNIPNYWLSVISCRLSVISCRVSVLVFCFLLLASQNNTYAQQKNIPLNRSSWIEVERKILLPDTDQTSGPLSVTYKLFHSSFKPIIESNAHTPTTINKDGKLLYRKVKTESLFMINDTSDKFHLTIDPLFNLELGLDHEDSLAPTLYKNTRGALIRGDIGKDFSFESSFYENQATFVNYIQNYNDLYGVIPGQGRWKRFKTNGYDFAMSSGYISYSPTLKNKKWFLNYQLGHGKHFIGDGYRSLLLSDNSFNYPYFRATTQYKKIQYTNLYTVFMNVNDRSTPIPPNTERLFPKKCGSFQYLNWSAHKRLQLGLFQGLIWEAADGFNKQHLDFFYFNPVIATNAFVYGMHDIKNILLGATTKIVVMPSMYLYGQYLLDDIAKDNYKGSISNKQGFQLGIKYFDVLKIKNLHVQLEYNRVRPYTYAHKRFQQTYTHYNQALAHPLGANFKETIGMLNYKLRDFFVQVKMNYASVGKDSLGLLYGNNIFISDNLSVYGPNSNINEQNQGAKSNITSFDFQLGYLINPSTNLNVVMGIMYREEILSGNKNTTDFIYVGLRTSLSNIYYDF